MSRHIVLDLVFYGNSLNYDQGSGNYQELKKITKWDGRQYTLVSRYALRYSMLDTAEKVGLFELADASNLIKSGKGDSTVIQPATEFLLTGDILEYPEFDLFGYLITETTPQNFRTAPVKVSHAVSMTPFMYDAHFNANIGLANRMRKRHGEMKPNPFTAEEHETFYQYSVVVDVDSIGEIEIYIAEGSDVTLAEGKYKLEGIERISGLDGDGLLIQLKKGKKNKKEIFQSEKVELLEFEKIDKVYRVRYRLKDEEKIKERIRSLLKTVMNLKRTIKARNEDLSPKLLVLGLYRDSPYRTFKDRIALLDEYTEEEYDEIEEQETDKGRILRVKHVTNKQRKPVFEVSGLDAETREMDNVEEFVEKIFGEGELSEVAVFTDPAIELKRNSGD
ncbi:type I-B CRISPR-associated protein Cas7/Cst2/DevR [Methanothermobacter sp. KEPCO-1]|uniref:type I-B CRISPR-associated protein Cas7/Cst2/DevR n=1 Tax=Methanothermobacter sp. KEPCO-1 TaxID=2603820 RepID=UPI0011C96004|nr:type I-B CRISPR-associated protein Cas7/Cst2/DevR [Methanothermobacter sp. KEPCO-1]QEF94768.1 type I-B CRISPR-associated protein Cas7/Cst2/DevR [Methanothermobacter sp. KEPCO-1]